MSEVGSADGFFGSDVTRTVEGRDTGTVSFGGVSISAADAAEFVMMHRTQVMKKVGADRTELAQQHLNRIRTARQHLTELIGLKRFVDTGKSYQDRVPATPELVSFLRDDVGSPPAEYNQRLMYYGSAVPNLPKSVLDHYGMRLDVHDVYQPTYTGKFPVEHAESGSQRYQLHNITCIDGDKLDSLKEDVNNYIDQQNDSNNLFMNKFKSVVNTMNESLEGANSMADKTHETIKNLVSRW